MVEFPAYRVASYTRAGRCRHRGAPAGDGRGAPAAASGPSAGFAGKPGGFPAGGRSTCAGDSRSLMRLFLIALMATALWGQESNLSAGFGEFQVRFLTRVEPPGENARERLPGGVVVYQGRVLHTIDDSANKREFAYELLLEPSQDGNTVQIRVESVRLPNPWQFAASPGRTLIELPKYPVIPKVKVGDTVALDLLVNPATGQKIVDYLTVVRRGGETAEPARDFTVADADLRIDRPRVSVNGKLVYASANSGDSVSGTEVYIYLAGHGRFMLSRSEERRV